MGPVIGDLLPVALGVAISPVPIIAVILMLLSPHASSTSLGFLAGWVVAVSLVVTLVTVLVDPADSEDSSQPAAIVAWLKILLGVTAIGLAVKQWRRRPTDAAHATLPAWMASIDQMTPVRAVGLGFLLAGVNPKNLTLCLAGGLSIGGATITTEDSVLAIVVFVVIASSTVAVPVLGYLVARKRMAAPLDELRGWLTENNAVVMSVLLLVIGVVIFGKGLAGL